MGGREACQLLVLDPLHQVRTGRPDGRMRLEVLDARVGIEEHGGAGRQVGKGHGTSGGGKSSSGSVAKRSASSALPVQPISPAVWRARLSRDSIVIRTVSCSFSGSGWAGRST